MTANRRNCRSDSESDSGSKSSATKSAAITTAVMLLSLGFVGENLTDAP